MAVAPFTVWCPTYAHASASRARTWRRRSATGASLNECADGALSGAWSVHGRGYHTTEACTPRPRDTGGAGRQANAPEPWRSGPARSIVVTVIRSKKGWQYDTMLFTSSTPYNRACWQEEQQP